MMFYPRWRIWRGGMGTFHLLPTYTPILKWRYDMNNKVYRWLWFIYCSRKLKEESSAE